jgi:hypothetical protein
MKRVSSSKETAVLLAQIIARLDKLEEHEKWQRDWLRRACQQHCVLEQEVKQLEECMHRVTAEKRRWWRFWL